MPTDPGISPTLMTEVLPGELAQIVQAVFGTMLSLEVQECAAPWFAGGNRLTSAVHLAGDWNGAVLLECDQLQACRFAARYLSTDALATDALATEASNRVDDVVRDVLAELANMIGGNMKCLLPGRTRLSMPSVMDGSNYSLKVCGAEIRHRLAFRCVEGTFWITVLGVRS